MPGQFENPVINFNVLSLNFMSTSQYVVNMTPKEFQSIFYKVRNFNFSLERLNDIHASTPSPSSSTDDPADLGLTSGIFGKKDASFLQ